MLKRKAAPRRRNGLAREVPPGSESRARAHEGSPGTWEIPSSPRQIADGRQPETKLQARRRGVRVGRGSEQASARRGTAKRRKRSAAGRAAGSRSAS